MKEKLTVGVATQEGVGRARELIRQEYKKQGFLQDEAAFERLSAHLDLRTTTTFLAERSGRILGTVSMMAYAERGIPMASIFEAEVERLREAARVVEVGQLAVDRERIGRSEGMKVMFLLFSKVLKHSQDEYIDYLCIVVNPRHEAFYDSLGFETLGRQDFYGAVSAPAVAKCLDVKKSVQNPIIRTMLQRVV